MGPEAPAARRRRLALQYAAGHTFDAIAKMEGVSRERIRQLTWGEAAQFWRRARFRQRDCTAEEVYYETELLRGPRQTFRFYQWEHVKSVPPPPPPPPPQMYKIMPAADADAEVLGVVVLRGLRGPLDDDTAARILATIDGCQGKWAEPCEGAERLPGNLAGRFVSQAELQRREITLDP